MYRRFQEKIKAEGFIDPSHLECDPKHLCNVPVGISGLGYTQMEWTKFIFFPVDDSNTLSAASPERIP